MNVDMNKILLAAGLAFALGTPASAADQLLPRAVAPREDSGKTSYSLQPTAYSLSAGEARAGDLEVHLYTTSEPGTAAQVLLSRSHLMALSEEGPPKPEPVAIEPEAVLREALYRIEPGYPAARLQAVFQATTRGPGWKSLALAGAGVTLEGPAKAESAGRTVALLPARGEGLYLLDAEGPVTITQTFMAPVLREGARFTLAFAAPRAAIGTVELAGSQPDYRGFALAGGVMEAGGTRGSLCAGAELRLTWTNAGSSGSGTEQPPAEPAAETRPQVAAELCLLGHVTERTVRLEGRVELTVEHRPVIRTVLALQPGLAVIDARSKDLADWSVTSGPTGQQLAIEWKSALSGHVGLTLTLEASREEGALYEVALPRVEGAYREKLFLGLSSQGNLQVEAEKPPEGIRQLDPSQAPAGLTRPGDRPLGLLFAAVRHGGAGPGPEAPVRLKVVRHEQVRLLTAVADLAEFWTHAGPDGLLLSRAHFLVKNNSEQFLRVRLPEGAKVMDSFVSGIAVVPALDGAGDLLIPLEKSGVRNTQAAAFPVDLTFREQCEPFREGSTLRFVLPRIHLPVSTLRWKLALPRDLEAVPLATNMQANSTYREVSYAGESGENEMQAQGRRLFEETAPPLRVPFPQMSRVDNYSLDILDPASAAPFLEARLVTRQTSRFNRSVAFALALLISFGMILHGTTTRGRRLRAGALLLISGAAVGVTSFQPETLALGLYFALGLFMGVTLALARWAAEWRQVPGA